MGLGGMIPIIMILITIVLYQCKYNVAQAIRQIAFWSSRRSLALCPDTDSFFPILQSRR